MINQSIYQSIRLIIKSMAVIGFNICLSSMFKDTRVPEIFPRHYSVIALPQ